MALRFQRYTPAIFAAFALWLAPARGRAEPDASAPSNRGARAALELGLHGIAPLRGYADRQIGAGVEAGVGVLFPRALVQFTLGFRHSVKNDDDSFTHLPVEAGIAYLLSDGEATPLIGGGVALQYLSEEVYVHNTLGTVVRSTTTDVIEDSLMGAGLFARAGALFMRSQVFTWVIALDYAVTFADFQERSSEHAVRLNVIALVGGL